ncbi:hypothetical protein O9K51_08651 [Purpureocillium lavendulum]|uniref:Nephrocystin 3-like N-terminal domain-containing protein n=1 Tax=Purpureocillium lavendulum TaxID=1247861 RepID=A0AB34FIK2_9HYPO|nr:hypothetical protein O9K51_08651 [Purpureocillium lavendulum]
MAILDNEHCGTFPMGRGDEYIFGAGDACGHNIIIATLPADEKYGTGSAAALASQVKRFFPSLWLGLLVGVAAGLPNLSRNPPLDIRLGDVLVGLSEGESAGIIAYDLGKETTEDGFQLLRHGHVLATTAKVIRSAIGSIRLREPDEANEFLPFYRQIKDKTHSGGTFIDPGQAKDTLYQVNNGGTEHPVERERRPDSRRTRVWYGPIGSGDTLMKNARKRDELRDKYQVIGLEMEAAGTMNCIPVGVIRGVCDYGDEHKNKEWQPYAAAMAAAYAKAILAKIGHESDARRDGQTLQHKYLKWLDPTRIGEHHGFLWIKGKPGAGKSTLMKFALADARKKMMHQTIISFFFNARGNDLEKSTPGLYRSLLLQLLERLPELECIFNSLAVLSLGKYTLVCFVDALDECAEDSIRDMGLSLIVESQEGHSQDIVNYLDTELKIGHGKVAEQIRVDLRAKASGVFMWVVLVVGILQREYDHGGKHLLQLRLGEIPGDLHELFRDILTRDRDSRDRLLLCIQWVLFARQPLKPEQLYFAVLSGVEPTAVSSWDPKEIEESDIRRFILSASKGLAEVSRSKTPTVQFIHESVNDFLKQDGLQDFWSDRGRNFEGDSQERLKQYCLSYMNMGIAGLDTDNLTAIAEARHSADRTYPFLEYAIRNVLFSYRRHLLSYLAEYGDEIMFAFILASGSHNTAIDAVEEDGRTPLSYAAEAGHDAFVRLLLDERAAINAADMDGRTPLSHAAERGHKAVAQLLLDRCAARAGHDALMQLLLERGAAIDAADKDGRTSLWLAAGTGHSAVVRLLLGQGAAINTADKDGRTPLSHAARTGHAAQVQLLLESEAAIDTADKDSRTPLSRAVETSEKAVMRLLIDRGATIDAADKNGRTPLSLAAGIGNDAVVRLLLDRGAAIDSADKDGRTPLSHAVETREKAVMRLLIDRGATIDAADRDGRTPLGLAARIRYTDVTRRQDDVMGLLLDWGAAIDSADKDGRTPLSHAAGTDNEAVVRLLLDRRATVDSADKDGRTPLSHAAGTGNGTVVRLLLGRGAAVDAADRDGRTPLGLAARIRYTDVTRRQVDVMGLLLDQGAVIDSADKDGQTPLSHATESGNEAVVRLLLGRGAAIDMADKNGQTPLSHAAERGNEAVVRLLLGRGAAIDKADKNGQTPLSHTTGSQYKAVTRHEIVVRLLLRRGAAIDAADKDGRTPLSHAAGTGYMAVVRLLLDRRATIDSADKDGRTPLSHAAGTGNDTVVRLLLDRRATIDSADKDGRTPLSHAAGTGNEAVVRLLLEQSAAIDVADLSCRTPLSHAARSRHEGFVRLLIDQGATIDAADKDGQTPLSHAAERGNEAVVRLLLDQGAAIDSADKSGRTPLSHATERGNEAMVRLLSDRGAAIDAVDKNDRTLLSHAAEVGNEAAVRLLLDQGAAIDLADKIGRTPLSYAAGSRYTAATRQEAVVQLLLDRGAAIDAADKDGRTPLSHAAATGHDDVPRLLHVQGAAIDAADKDGRTPLSYAAGNRREGVVRLLKLCGAKSAPTEWVTTHELTDPRNKAEKIATHLSPFAVVLPRRVFKVFPEPVVEVFEVDVACRQRTHNFDIGIQRQIQYGFTSWAEVLSKRNIVRVHVAIFAHIWSQYSGTNALMYYIVYIFQMAGLSGTTNVTISSIQCIINVLPIGYRATLAFRGESCFVAPGVACAFPVAGYTTTAPCTNSGCLAFME